MSSSRVSFRLVRLGLAALGITLALGAGLRFAGLRMERDAHAARLEGSGIPLDPRVRRELFREPESAGVRLRAARAVLAGEMAQAAALDPSSPDGREEMLASSRRLEEAARLAGEVLAERPASWEAAMVLGAATYMSRSFSRDSQLFTAAHAWEEPLQAARRLAPAKREPARFLAAAYLEIWPALSPPKRELTRELVTGMFRNPEDLTLLLDPWLAAVDPPAALSVIPPDPKAWEQVQSFYANRGDWQTFSVARQRWDRTLRAYLQERLALADARLARNDARTARVYYLEVAEQVRPDARYRDLLDAALTRCPPGPVGSQTAERLAPRLDWVLERCLLSECPLPPTTLKRLARLAGDQSPSQEAMAFLLAGDLPEALSLERRSETLWSEEWAPYLVVKARVLTERRRLAEAQDALDLVHPSWWQRPTYWLTRLEFARVAGRTGEARKAEEKLRTLARHGWAATEWTWRQGRARLEMLLDGPARGIEIDLAEVPEAGAVIEPRLDGAALGTFPVRRGQSLRQALPLAPGLHVLEIESVGGRVVPGAVRLR